MVVRQSAKRDLIKNLYDFDEHIMIISDWDHELGIDKFLGHYHGGRDNKPPNILINGLGRFTKRADDKHNTSATMPVAAYKVKQVWPICYAYI